MGRFGVEVFSGGRVLWAALADVGECRTKDEAEHPNARKRNTNILFK
jgi:hypothetical protein